jgi:hypothetical protein
MLSRVTLSRLWCYAGIRQVLPGRQSRRPPRTHRRGQPFQSGASNAKNAPESAICGVLPNRPTPTGCGPWLVPISIPGSAPRRVRRTNLRSDPVLNTSRRFAAPDHPIAAQPDNAIAETIPTLRQIGEADQHLETVRKYFLELNNVDHQPRLAGGFLELPADRRQHRRIATTHCRIALGEPGDERPAGRRRAIA